MAHIDSFATAAAEIYDGTKKVILQNLWAQLLPEKGVSNRSIAELIEGLKGVFTKQIAEHMLAHVNMDADMNELRQLGKPHGLTSNDKWVLQLRLAVAGISPRVQPSKRIKRADDTNSARSDIPWDLKYWGEERLERLAHDDLKLLRTMCAERHRPVSAGAHGTTCVRELLAWKEQQADPTGRKEPARRSDFVERNAEIDVKRPGMRGRRPEGAKLNMIEARDVEELERMIRAHASDSHHKLYVRRAGGTENPMSRKNAYFSTDGYTGLFVFTKVPNMKSLETRLIRLMDQYRDANDNKHRVSNCPEKEGFVYVLCGDKHW